MTCRERAVSFGEGGALSGILTSPVAGSQARHAVLLLNAGLLPHVGPVRLYTRLARALASDGAATLRFDLRGLGDSAPRASSRGAEEDAIDDTLAAIAFLQQATGMPSCLAGGLCSASDNAFRAALRTEAITGLIQLDPWVHATVKFKVRRYGPALFRARAWRNVLVGRTSLLEPFSSKVSEEQSGQPADLDPNERAFPPRQWVEASYAQLIARGVRILSAFSGGPYHYYNYQGQLRDAYPGARFGTLLTERYFESGDHLFSQEAQHRETLACIVDWLRSVRGPFTGGGV